MSHAEILTMLLAIFSFASWSPEQWISLIHEVRWPAFRIIYGSLPTVQSEPHS